MSRNYWTSSELKKHGVHYKTARAIMRIQRKEIYANKRFNELRTKICRTIGHMHVAVDNRPACLNL